MAEDLTRAGLPILVVEDDEGLRSLVERQLERAGFRALGVGDGQQAVEVLGTDGDFLMLLDYQLPDMTASELLDILDRSQRRVPFIVMTGFGDERTAVQMMKAGARDYLIKDATFLDMVVEVVGRVSSRISTERELARAEGEILRGHRELQALHNALLAMSQTLDLDEVLEEIACQARTALDCFHSSIALVTKDGGLGKATDDAGRTCPGEVAVLPVEMTREVIDTGRPVLVDDVGLLSDVGVGPPARGARSYAGIPVVAGGRVIGVLFVYSQQPHAFSDRLSLLTDFANQAAIAIENARLYREAGVAGALREAERLRSELLENVSHELRTPLASIKGYSTMLLRHYDKMDEEERLDSLKEIDAASDKLARMVEGLLQISALESEGLPSSKEEVDIGPLVERAIALAGARRASSHRFVHHVPDSLPRVEADPRRIQQLLVNLLDNALKFSSAGSEIAVDCRLGEGELVVTVRDQGMGIAARDIDHIFDRFYRADTDASHTIGGAGLGLFLCKRIVEAHGGRIWVESQPGEGSTFGFSLPLRSSGES